MRTWRRSAGSSRRTTKPCSTSRSTWPLIVDSEMPRRRTRSDICTSRSFASSIRIFACDIVTSMPRNSGTWICSIRLRNSSKTSSTCSTLPSGDCCSLAIAGYFAIAEVFVQRERFVNARSVRPVCNSARLSTAEPDASPGAQVADTAYDRRVPMPPRIPSTGRRSIAPIVAPPGATSRSITSWRRRARCRPARRASAACSTGWARSSSTLST